MMTSHPPLPPSLHLPPPHPLSHLQYSLNHPQPKLPPLTEDELSRKPRPHPHVNSSTLFLNHVPSTLSESDLARELKECMPVRIKLFSAVPPSARFHPNAFYDWMPRSGTLAFDDMVNVEKALAILTSNPIFTSSGCTVSTYSNQSMPLTSSSGRYIRPTNLVHPPPPLNGALNNPEAAFQQTCPSPGEVFLSLRSWGSLRSVSVFAEGPPGECPTTWGARVEFWYEDEARRFDIGFGQLGNNIKGWQVSIFSEPPHNSLSIATPNSGMPSAMMIPHPSIKPPNAFSAPSPWNTGAPPIPPSHPTLGMPWVPTDIPTAGHFTPSVAGISLQANMPLTPPLSYIPPWAQHNAFTINGTDRPFDGPISPPYGDHLSLPSTPSSRRGSNTHTRHRSNSSRTSLSSFRGQRQRTWSLTVDQTPDGAIRPTGLIANDGTVIQHGPGQHIRPAPLIGPGSTSASGLVDYSNVFVKNLDPDINSDFLGSFFESVGTIVSACVMRDDKGRSRGYGFVSFELPDQAATAISVMNGQKLGNQTIAVTLHEPRLLRTEKLAERRRKTGPTPFGRIDSLHSSTSRNSTSSSQSQKSPDQLPGGTDEIRSLSPEERKKSLTRRVTSIVIRYANDKDISDKIQHKIIQALIAHDLALIPLLHDPPAMQLRIEETLAVIQQELDLELDASKASLTGISATASNPPPSSPDSLSISPPQLLHPLPDPKDISSISDLVSLSSTHLLKLLNGEEGSELMSRLDLRQPSALDINSNGVTTGTLSGKGIVEQKMDLAGIIAKKIDGNMKKSAKLKLAGELVNKEQDLDALCALLPYTDLIRAKIEHYRTKGKMGSPSV